MQWCFSSHRKQKIPENVITRRTQLRAKISVNAPFHNGWQKSYGNHAISEIRHSICADYCILYCTRMGGNICRQTECLTAALLCVANNKKKGENNKKKKKSNVRCACSALTNLVFALKNWMNKNRIRNWTGNVCPMLLLCLE